MKMNKTVQRIGILTLTTVLAMALAGPVLAGSEGMKSASWQGQAKDAWIDGKVEASFALSRYLNPFTIDTEVKHGVVHLTGKVDSDIDRDLAGEIAQGIDGVEDVKNDLVIEAGSAKENTEARDFATQFEDATTTARVKLALLANSNTKGLGIDVDTENGVVSLSGKVDSKEESQLAEQIASNAEGVDKVRNRLETES